MTLEDSMADLTIKNCKEWGSGMLPGGSCIGSDKRLWQLRPAGQQWSQMNEWKTQGEEGKAARRQRSIQAFTMSWSLTEAGTTVGGEVEHGLGQRLPRKGFREPAWDWNNLPVSEEDFYLR